MIKFIKKLSHYDGSKFLKKALNKKISLASINLEDFKTNWAFSSSTVISTLNNLQERIKASIESVKSETGAWGWITGTNESYRNAVSYLKEAYDRANYLSNLIKKISEHIKLADSLDKISFLQSQSIVITQSFTSIEEEVAKLGTGEIDSNSDITEYLTPIKDRLKILDSNCQQLSALLNDLTVTGTTTATSTSQAPQATEPQEPARKAEWDESDDTDTGLYGKDQKLVFTIKRLTTGNHHFNLSIAQIKDERLPWMGNWDNGTGFKDLTNDERLNAMRKYNANWRSVADQIKQIIDSRKAHLQSLKSEGRLDDAAFKRLMQEVSNQEAQIPSKDIRLEEYGFSSTTGAPTTN